MYEFDEQRWDRQTIEVHDETAFVGGWLIQKGIDSLRAHSEHCDQIYLQIGTGQWCSAMYATRFPTKTAAIAYAQKFGYRVGQTAQIVPFRF